MPRASPAIRCCSTRNCRTEFSGQDFMEVQEKNIPVIVNCNAIVDGKIFMTLLDTPYEHD